MLTFLHPERLLWALVAGAIVLMYLRSLVPRDVETPHLGLWQKALARRSPWSGWQRILSLATQLAAVFLFAIALGEPIVATGEPEPRLVLVVDCTASMKARFAGGTRMDSARAGALQILEETDPRVPVALVVYGATVELRAPLGTPREKLRAEIDALQATDGAASVDEAMQVAAAIAGPSQKPVLISDGGSLTPPRKRDAPSSSDAITPTFAAANLALTRLVAKPDPSQPGQYLVLAEVSNFTKQDATARVEFRWRGDARPAGTATASIPAGAASAIVVPLEGQAAGLLTVSLAQNSDDLATDDVARLQLPPLRETQVVLVGQLPSALATTLRVAPRIKVNAVDQLPAVPDAETIYILSGELPAKLPPRALVVDPASGCDLFTVESSLEAAWNLDVRSSSPLLEPIDLEDAIVERIRIVKFTAPAEQLASGSATKSSASMLAVYPPTPVVATVETPERRAVVVAIDLATSDFLLRRGIDEFFARACEWLVERDARERQGQNTAEAIVVASEKNSRSFVLEAGKGVQPIRVAIAENSLAAGPVPAVGVWRLADAAGKVDAKSPTIPVSLLNAHESDLRSEPKEVALATSNLTIALWIWPALLGFALLVAEWVLFHRKITI